jgi:hypothetical protein
MVITTHPEKLTVGTADGVGIRSEEAYFPIMESGNRALNPKRQPCRRISATGRPTVQHGFIFRTRQTDCRWCKNPASSHLDVHLSVDGF